MPIIIIPAIINNNPKSDEMDSLSDKKKQPYAKVIQKLRPLASGTTIENFANERALKNTRADIKIMINPTITLIRDNRLM